uniref:Uncharacterized protein n=1 Tax=Knipowitschia caucasica TaxID=637954 RepID=A0AAV2M0B3_KNICA
MLHHYSVQWKDSTGFSCRRSFTKTCILNKFCQITLHALSSSLLGTLTPSLPLITEANDSKVERYVTVVLGGRSLMGEVDRAGPSQQHPRVSGPSAGAGPPLTCSLTGPNVACDTSQPITLRTDDRLLTYAPCTLDPEQTLSGVITVRALKSR